MGFDEPHPSYKRSSPIRLIAVGYARYKGRSCIVFMMTIKSSLLKIFFLIICKKLSKNVKYGAHHTLS
jgi:hypothetical protein